MTTIAEVRGLILRLLLVVTLACVISPLRAEAETDGCKFVGSVGYSYVGNSVLVNAQGITNSDPSGVSGALRMELWAGTAPYTGTAFSGYKLAQYDVGQLASGTSISNIQSASLPYQDPPKGIWALVMFLTEYTGASSNDGYTPTDWRNLSAPLAVPQIGLWWNPAESGSGYALDYKHGTLVVTVYSYLANGTAQWYLAAGAVSGTTFAATLDKYVGGQCISCGYTRGPSSAGNDGAITIEFSSATAATLRLPNGRVTQIQPEAF